MLTVDFQDIIENAAGFCGLERDNLDAAEFAILRGFANNRLRYAWNYRAWDDLERTQERWFRADYNNATAYSAPTTTTSTEVFDAATQAYYQVLRASTGNAPSIAGVENSAYWAVCADEYSGSDWAASKAYVVGDQVFNPETNRYYQCHTAHTSTSTFDATKFGILTPFDRYVAYEQAGKDALGDITDVWDSNPKIHGDAERVEHWSSENGIQVLEDRVTVWIEFRTRAPQLKGAAFDATATYTASVGQIYYINNPGTRGNFYNCVTTTSAGEDPDDTPAKWSRIEVPRIFQSWLENGMAADWWGSPAGGDDPKASRKYDALADEFLAVEALRHDEQQNQRAVANVR